eukprot:TRINITY_DN963_c0_g1_i1.p1 TRINITY_DN963_c0_g1~~TRINITY_DN963_c0_g1_i1.p1  ORF type:complete len:261 (+),score=4.28 TRINITY_DN963_c0_g1_i1:50-784(+)
MSQRTTSTETFPLNKVVKLNVGGQIFQTTVSTLTKYQNNFFYSMFSGHFNTQPNEDGSFFIDKDPFAFRHILNYLRGDLECYIKYLSDQELSILLHESIYYGLKGLEETITEHFSTKESKVMKRTTSKTLVKAAASTLKKGNYVVINNHPCKIVEVYDSGGETKLTGIDIFTGRKYEFSAPNNAQLDVPLVRRNEYKVCPSRFLTLILSGVRCFGWGCTYSNKRRTIYGATSTPWGCVSRQRDP